MKKYLYLLYISIFFINVIKKNVKIIMSSKYLKNWKKRFFLQTRNNVTYSITNKKNLKNKKIFDNEAIIPYEKVENLEEKHF